MAPPDARLVLFYDGACGLCDRTVRFVLRHDRRDRFRFATLQGDLARRTLPRHGLDPESLDSLSLVIDFGAPGERVLQRGRAILRIAGALGFPWALALAFAILPTALIDAAYDAVARRRHRLVGTLDACRVPGEAERAKFLEPPPG